MNAAVSRYLSFAVFGATLALSTNGGAASMTFVSDTTWDVLDASNTPVGKRSASA